MVRMNEVRYELLELSTLKVIARIDSLLGVPHVFSPRCRFNQESICRDRFIVTNCATGWTITRNVADSVQMCEADFNSLRITTQVLGCSVK